MFIYTVVFCLWFVGMLVLKHMEPFDVEMGDRLEDMICNLGQESFQ